MILPLTVLGSSSTKTTRLGFLNPASRSRAVPMISASVAVMPSRRTMTAVTFSPHFGSGSPTTAASATDGCVYSTSSTSREYTFSPPVMIMSFIRSTM